MSELPFKELQDTRAACSDDTRTVARLRVLTVQTPLPALVAVAAMMAVGISFHTAEAFMATPTSFVPRAGARPSVAAGTET